jgi:hypothetical protein
MKRLTFLLQLSLISFLAFAQSDPLQMNIEPTSPNAYAFAKYVDFPTSTYTGVIPISIPLGSLSDKGAKIDLSLSYHASGIKVDEIASWVGLGWSLNAGGTITRVANGIPERPDGNGGILPQRMDIGFPDLNAEGNFDNLNDLFVATTPQVDIEPDIYYYNFGGRSGKFIFDNNENIQFFKYEDLKIDYLISDPSDNTPGNVYKNSKFIITDESGMKYEFDYVEASFSHTVGFAIPTSWYLTKIESPQGGVIEISYTERSISHFYNEQTSVLVNVGDNVDLETVWPKPVLMPTQSTEVFLESISTSSSGRIAFTANTSSARQDCYHNSFPLDEISFFDQDNNPIKHIEFETSYFVAPEYTPDFPGYNQHEFEHLRYRLKLDGIQIFSGDKQDSQPPYTFEYYSDENPTLYNLPYRLSPDQDHWGYFNNAGNTTMIPEISDTHYSGYWFNLLLAMSPDDSYFTNDFSGGANREGDAEAVKSCALHKVIYPTGGYTIYDLESQEYGNNQFGDTGGGLRTASITHHLSDGSVAKKKNYIYKYFNSNLDPAYDPNGPGTGVLSGDPRRYYVLLGKYQDFSSGGDASYGVPSGDIGSIFGDWSQVTSTPSPYVVKISANPQAQLGTTHGNPVGYSTVIEHEPGNGYIVYNYSTYLEYPDYWDIEESIDLDAPSDIFTTQYSTTVTNNSGDGGPASYFFEGQHRVVVDNIPCNQFPFLPLYDADWKRGMLISKKIYTEDRGIISNESFEYFRPNQANIPGYKVYSLSDVSGTAYIHGKYYIPANWVALKKQTTTQYSMDGGDPLTSIKEIEYESIHHKLPTTERSWDSKNELTLQKNYYAQEYNDGVENITSLKVNNMIGKPIKTEIIRENNLIAGTVVKYNNQGDPVEVFRYENELMQGPASHDPAVMVPPNYYSKGINTYDHATHLLLQNESIVQVPTAYIWGYNNTLPIAKVVNAVNAPSEQYGDTLFIDTNDTFERSEPASSGQLISNINLTHVQAGIDRNECAFTHAWVVYCTHEITEHRLCL